MNLLNSSSQTSIRLNLSLLHRMRVGTIKTSMLVLLSVLITGLSAHASFVLNVEQVGNDVVATGSGTINTAALTSPGGASYSALLGAAEGTAIAGSGGSVALWQINPANTFGSGGRVFASSGTGQTVGIIDNDGLYTPSGYVSGSALSDTATWLNQSFSTLGLTAGTYTWNWGTGITADSFTLNIGTAPVPEPATMALLAVGTLAVIGYRRK